MVMDGQWGSTGKGKLVGYLALRNEIAAATCNFMSNAGHTFTSDDGKKLVTCQLPTSVVNSDTLLILNAGAAITVKKLLQEIEETGCASRLLIHPHAVIITEADLAYEAASLKKISSTLKGCGGALARKVMRQAMLAKDCPELKAWIGDTTGTVHKLLHSGGTVLVEGAQGFDLSLNHGFEYPYVTSRDVTTMSILNDAAIPFRYLGDVYGCLRACPIRVGDQYESDGTKVGTSGPYYADQAELTWEQLRHMSGATRDLVERTTVTQKVRRVFTFSYTQMHRFIDVCSPTHLFMNFINHVDARDEGKRSFGELSTASKTFLSQIQHSLEKRASRFMPPRLSLVGTGAPDSDMVEV